MAQPSISLLYYISSAFCTLVLSFLLQHGKPRFVILFTDYLVVLKGRKPSVPSKLGGVFSFQQSSRIDWFSDLEYTARKVQHFVLIMYCTVSDHSFFIASATSSLDSPAPEQQAE